MIRKRSGRKKWCGTLFRIAEVWTALLAILFVTAGTALAETDSNAVYRHREAKPERTVESAGPGRVETDSNGAGKTGVGKDGNKIITASNGMAVGTLAALATDSNAYFYEDERLLVTVRFAEDPGLPEDAALSVCVVDPESDAEQFGARCREFRGKWAGAPETMKLFEMGFRTGDGEEIPVHQEAEISVRYLDEPLVFTDGLSVVHFTDREPRLLPIIDVESRGEREILMVAFRTDGFSEFAFVTDGVMPIAGGPGTGVYTMAGALALVSAGLLYRRKRTKS